MKYSEARANRILQLELSEKLITWDKANPKPKEPTLQQQVAAALHDPCWLKSAAAIAGRDNGNYGWADLERSAAVALLFAPARKHGESRKAYIAKMESENRSRLIEMLRET